ncbi:precorrin-3B C(17)-methyltransferase [Treponema sp. C6A8]|uniref:precorrin-3B C(17)-methyltransferase n=1 Tax=Treponema sp. C6A8 TaxID=1410609 RepID=UPI0004880507|nr:precorrin-3B C(17)-methyltransferase [Treponema sp. C6A8]
MIYIVGIGPGKTNGMTIEARAALEASDVIVGYGVYIDLVRESFPNKEFAQTSMGKEIERCKLCFDFALQGKTVSMICSGDAGVYGMAEPILSLQNENSAWQGVEISIIPGVTAATSGAAELGAPLNHDFCVISLSDLLTPWEIIERRLQAAITGDFAIAIYNPSSHKRADYLKKACEIMLKAGASPERACGYVQNIGRSGTRTCTCMLCELQNALVDMFTTVFIGNSQSQILKTPAGTKLITKRGYKI